MGKGGRIGNLARRRDFLISFWGTFLAVLGLPSALLTILGKHFSVGLTSFLVLLAFSASVLANRNKWRKRHLPVQDIAPEDVEAVGRKTIRCPSDLKLTEQVGRLARYEYGGATISPIKYEPLRVKNPYILACLVGPQGDFLGYFDVIPLKQSFADLFLRGSVTEKDLTHEDVLAPHEMRLCKYLYVSGIAVAGSDTYTGCRNAHILVWGLLKYLDHFYRVAKPYTFASAVTEAGEDLLRSFKLTMVCDAGRRRDGHAMYALTLSRDEIAKRLACVPDWSLLCSLDWSSDPISSRKTLQKNSKVPLPRCRRHRLSA